jgi:uncharacterized protein YutE (UPF0331/DUF86 family)
MKKEERFLKRIKSEILAELEHISNLMKEYDDFLNKYAAHMDIYLLRVQASFMADFYMGMEKILRLIAEELNGGVPRGEGWHKKLLHTMTIEIDGVRPPVISKKLYEDLLKFLAFRHVVRQAYGFQLNEKKLIELEKIFKKTYKGFHREIKKFCSFLDGKANR